MNKSTINNPGKQEWLDKILAENNTDYIDDAGFTDKVMHRLPPPRLQHRRLQLIILGCAGLLSLAAFLLSAPGLASLYVDCLNFLRTQPLYNLSALALTIYTVASALTWWVINPDI